ncbi:hypothetical protein ABZ479_18510 [Streptomyces sp. NPDC005722]
MEWPIAQVARTSRHHDETGLLSPVRAGNGGLRSYGEARLLRPQQILVPRTPGLGLPEIGRLLARQVDEVEAPRGHHRHLLAGRDPIEGAGPPSPSTRTRSPAGPPP